MRLFLSLLVFTFSLLWVSSAMSCDSETGDREQLILLSWNEQSYRNWEAPLGYRKKVTLPNGQRIAVELNEPSIEAYGETSGQARYVPELVRLTLYTLSEGEEELVSESYAGANSLQRFGRPGSVNPIEGLGSAVLALNLLKPACVDLDSIASQ